MVRYIQIKLLEDETSLREYANASEIYIEITIFCENDVVVRDTTWLKNIEQFAEVIRFLSDKELKKYTVNFLDNPIEIIFMKSDGYVEYKVKSLHGERNCKINIIDLKYERSIHSKNIWYYFKITCGVKSMVTVYEFTHKGERRTHRRLCSVERGCALRPTQWLGMETYMGGRVKN